MCIRDRWLICEDRSPVCEQEPPTASPSTTTIQAKRARVEHIVSNIRTPAYTEDPGGRSTSLELTRGDGQRRSKRKQMLPQQHDSAVIDEDRQSVNGHLSDDDDDIDDDDYRRRYRRNDDDDDGGGGGGGNQTASSSEQMDDDEDRELHQQLRIVQCRLEDMYAKYAKSLHENDRHLSTSPSPHNDSYPESDSKMDSETERLTSLLREVATDIRSGVLEAAEDRRLQALPGSDDVGLSSSSSRMVAGTSLLRVEVSHVVEGLVDRLVQRFVKKHVLASRRRPPPISDERLDVARLSLPVFPPPPPLFPPLPFPVCGADMAALRRAYTERCAYVDALMQRARTTTAATRPLFPHDDAVANHNNSTSGCATMTSPSTENVDRCPAVSIIQSRGLLTDQQLLQPPTQVPNILEWNRLS